MMISAVNESPRLPELLRMISMSPPSRNSTLHAGPRTEHGATSRLDASTKGELKMGGLVSLETIGMISTVPTGYPMAYVYAPVKEDLAVHGIKNAATLCSVVEQLCNRQGGEYSNSRGILTEILNNARSR